MGSPISQPLVTIQLLAAQIVDTFKDRRNLIIGQTGLGGTAVDKALITDVHLMTDAQLITIFGNDYLYGEIVAWRTAVNVVGGGIIPVLDVISVSPNGGGTAATSIFTFTGTATAAGEFVFSIVDEGSFTINLTIPDTTTATQAGDLLVTAIGELTNEPFTAVNVAGAVTVTATDVGTVGNSYGLKVSGLTAGLSIATTGWTGGATNPSFTDVLDNIQGIRYTGLLWPEAWSDDLDPIVAAFDLRFNASNNIQDGVIFTGLSATVADAKTFVSTRNSQSLVVMGNSVVDVALNRGPVILRPADYVASEFMAIRAKRLATGAQIGNLVISPKGLDATGGAALASLAYHNTPLAQTPVTSPSIQYTETEQIELRDDGFTVYGVNTEINGMLMSDVVTTRTTDGSGNANDSFLFLNFVDTGSVSREIIFRTLKAAYPQSRLTDGDLIAGRSIENEGSIKEQLMQIYAFLATLVLVQAGSVATAFFADNTSVTIILSGRQVTIEGPLPIVTQIGKIDYNLSLIFNITGNGLELTT